MLHYTIWVVVKIMVPFGVPITIRHPLFRVPQKETLILTTTHITSTALPRIQERPLGSVVRNAEQPGKEDLNLRV